MEQTPFNRMVRAQRSALTRAVNGGIHLKVIACVNKAFNEFDRLGWPDDWSDWQRARDDAQAALRRIA